MFKPMMTFQGALNFATLMDREREDVDATERKALENTMKDLKAKEEEQKKTNYRSNSYGNNYGRYNGGRRYNGRGGFSRGRGGSANFSGYNPNVQCHYCNRWGKLINNF